MYIVGVNEYVTGFGLDAIYRWLSEIVCDIDI